MNIRSRASLILVASAVVVVAALAAISVSQWMRTEREFAASDGAGEILKQMTLVYRSCSAYADAGEVVTVFEDGRQDRRSFETLFQRPKQMLYQLDYEVGGRNRLAATEVLWSEGQQVRVWRSLTGEVKEFESMELGLASSTPASNGVTVAVLPLVLDLQNRWRIDAIRDPILVDEDETGGRTCHLIRGAGLKDEQITLWIDQESFLIRRIDGLAEGGASSTARLFSNQPLTN